MSYLPERFGTLTLPTYDPDADTSTGKYETAYTALESGGAIDDLDEDDIARPAVTGISYGGTVEADTRELLTDALDALRAWVGVRAKLYARELTTTPGAGEVRWRWARLVSVGARRKPGHPLHQEVTFTWASESPWWYAHHHGGGWVLDDGKLLDEGYFLDESDIVTLNVSPKTYALVNPSNRPIEDIQFTLDVKTTNCTAFGIATASTDLDFTGTVNAAKALVIDCGAQSVRNDGVAAYDDLAFGAGHVVDPWTRAERSATTTYTFTNTGAGVTSTVTLDYWEQWA